MGIWQKIWSWVNADPLDHHDDPLDATLLDVWNLLRTKRFVDLTHPFEPRIPNDSRTDLCSSIGQRGTHVAAPNHAAKGLRSLDEIDVREMMFPLVILDIHEKVGHDPDYVVTLEDVHDWESRFGLVPEGSFVALRTDWSLRWPDATQMHNRDDHGIDHFPGWSLEVLQYLYETRQIAASGHETLTADPGLSASREDRSLEAYVLGQNKFQVDLLTNLHSVPPWGALLVVAFPKAKGATGFPARVFAITP